MPFLQIPKERFEAYFYGRSPFVKLFSSELDWFLFENESVAMLAVMLRCEIDNDFNAVVLGRDAEKKFRAIHIIVSKNSQESLLDDLNACAADLLSRHVNGIFPQGDESAVPFSIFLARVSEEKRNHYYKLLTDDPVHFPAKVMMEELAHWFIDPDGVFIRRFQGNEFNSRLFELYLHAVFYELEFEIDRSFAQPDYLLKKMGKTISLEAVTVAEIEATEQPTDFNLEQMGELIRYANEEMPFKFAHTLRKKVNHRPQPAGLPYWDLPHTKGCPFVLAVHDYSRKMSMTVSSVAMQSYLYGITEQDGVVQPIERHELGSRTISSNFFAREEHRYISAVMLPTGATIPKFNRMGRIAGLRSPNSFAIIHGTRTDESGDPKPFRSLVEHPSYREFWHEGIYMYHNPNAIHPLDPELFPHILHVFQGGDGLEHWLPPNYIVSSFTQMMRFDPGDADKVWAKLEASIQGGA